MGYKQVVISLICAYIVNGYVSSRPKICGTPDNSRGVCVHKTQCEGIIKFLRERKTLTRQEERAIKEYDCGTSRKQGKVCCPRGDFNLDWAYDSCRTKDQEEGKCKPLVACRAILDYINNPSSVDQGTLQKYVCKKSTSVGIHVCCSNNMVFNRYIDIRPEKPIDHSKHGNIHLLPTRCGEQSAENKVLNGITADLYEFPWAAALKIKTGNSFGYDCGGSLISDRYVLTAAHCIHKNMSQIVGVRLGEYDFQHNIDCAIAPNGFKYCAPPHEDFEIALNDTIVHPTYNPVSYKNDIALIRLRRPVNITYSIAPICLPITVGQKLNYETGKLKFVVIGWGRTLSGAKSNVLLKAQVPFQSIGKCTNGVPSKGQLCAGGTNETDACEGDSGGPLLADFASDGKLVTVQYGIVSSGPFVCATVNYPTTYTDVTAYMDWILNNLKP
ncbi:hypothetical protein Trydic_g15621 [Trypoxylus dichotomus]